MIRGVSKIYNVHRTFYCTLYKLIGFQQTNFPFYIINGRNLNSALLYIIQSLPGRQVHDLFYTWYIMCTPSFYRLLIKAQCICGEVTLYTLWYIWCFTKYPLPVGYLGLHLQYLRITRVNYKILLVK